MNKYSIIGHRGNKEKFTENTIEGYVSIMENSNIYGLELDINITKDKQLILNHDRFIEIDKEKYYIHDYTLQEIKKIIKQHNLNKKLLPTFSQFIDVLNRYNASDKIILIEIKSLPSSEKIDVKEYVSIVHKSIDQIKNKTKIYIISFDYRIIKISKEINKEINTGLILHRNLIPIEHILENCKFDILVLNKFWITEEEVKIAHKFNKQIFCWTVNTIKELEKLKKIGVDYSISDYPESLSK
jgi:glycerophosphoryl diester phosphodiesterase